MRGAGWKKIGSLRRRQRRRRRHRRRRRQHRRRCRRRQHRRRRRRLCRRNRRRRRRRRRHRCRQRYSRLCSRHPRRRRCRRGRGRRVHIDAMSGIDYRINLLDGAPKTMSDKLQRVMNAAARITSNTRKFDHGLTQLRRGRSTLAGCR